MLRMVRITYGTFCFLWVLSSWIFSYDIPFHFLSLAFSVLLIDQSVDLMKRNRTIQGSITLLISTMMAFIFIEALYPIT